MTEQHTVFRTAPISFRSATGWLAAALMLGSVGALVGVPLFYLFIALALVVVFSSLVIAFPSEVMVASVWALALCPFSFGVETGVLPKIFADEILLLLYLLTLLPMYWTTNRVWQMGFSRHYWILTAFVLCQCLSLLVRTDLIAFRNLLETFVLGPLLLVVFLQEASNTDRDELFAAAVVWLTVVIAVLSVAERVVQRNPILEQLDLVGGFQYMSPQIVALTEGVYRPYVTFFHPSETGTFMAMGLVYAVRGWMRKRNWLAALQVMLVVAGLAVNATRGVWAGAALSLLLLARNPITIVMTAVPMAGLGSAVAYIALRATPFMQRLTDLDNLLGRFVYWQLGAKVFFDHKILGVGHMQFQKVYLDYVHNLSALAEIRIKQIYVIDSVYITTAVEHGIVGLIALILFFVATGMLLSRFRKRLLDAKLPEHASLVRASQMILVVYTVSGFFADVNEFTKATKFFFILIGFGLGAGARALRSVEYTKIDRTANPSLESEYA